VTRQYTSITSAWDDGCDADDSNAIRPARSNRNSSDHARPSAAPRQRAGRLSQLGLAATTQGPSQGAAGPPPPPGPGPDTCLPGDRPGLLCCGAKLSGRPYAPSIAYKQWHSAVSVFFAVSVAGPRAVQGQSLLMSFVGLNQLSVAPLSILPLSCSSSRKVLELHLCKVQFRNRGSLCLSCSMRCCQGRVYFVHCSC
jgi:hypothetical protein